MSEKTIRKKAWAEGYRLQKYKWYILIIDIHTNGILQWCGSFDEVMEYLED